MAKSDPIMELTSASWPLSDLLGALRAAADPTRLRLLSLCALGEITVGDLTEILGQSQPRVSRHLRLLCYSRLLDRHPEGSFVFYRLADGGRGATLASRLSELLPTGDETLRLDRKRLAAIHRRHETTAAKYFRANAPRWDKIRALHIQEREAESALLALLPTRLGGLLDIGTGTGRTLQLLAGRATRAIGIDLSRDMLALARARLVRAGLTHCQVRQADMYRLPWPGPAFDTIVIHHVLHFAEAPGRVIADAARVLRPGGRLVAVDFARHDLEALRTEHAHRRLGFADN
ncbi:MAG: ArsR/SmtB family transcription factor, partial [Dongiaceae bacterium]